MILDLLQSELNWLHLLLITLLDYDLFLNNFSLLLPILNGFLNLKNLLFTWF